MSDKWLHIQREEGKEKRRQDRMAQEVEAEKHRAARRARCGR